MFFYTIKYAQLVTQNIGAGKSSFQHIISLFNPIFMYVKSLSTLGMFPFTQITKKQGRANLGNKRKQGLHNLLSH